VLQVDVGEPEPRTIVSGLVKFVSVDDMTNRKVGTGGALINSCWCFIKYQQPPVPSWGSSPAE